jgi:Ca2+-binding EF-hand superfamily protein
MTQHATFRDGDANGDGSVDEDDLAIVLKNLGNRCD